MLVSEVMVAEPTLPVSEGSIRLVCQKPFLLSFRELPILPPNPAYLVMKSHHWVDTPYHKRNIRDGLNTMHLLTMPMSDSLEITEMMGILGTSVMSGRPREVET